MMDLLTALGIILIVWCVGYEIDKARAEARERQERIERLLKKLI